LETQETNETTEVVIEDPKAVLSALERAKSDAKKYREQAEQLENALNEKDSAIAQVSGKLLNQKLIQKLATEGINDPDRVLKFININNLSFDDDFNLIGFEDQFETLKNDLPEVFDAKLRVGGQADTAIKASVSTTYSATELQAAKILGKL
jgi:hypothetical protein